MGWLGWTAAEALAHTPYEIELAISQKIEWVRLTDPFRKPEKGRRPAKPPLDERGAVDRREVDRRFKAAMKRLGARVVERTGGQ